MYKDKVLIFIHIPKTAGAALTNIICEQYDPHEVFSLSDPILNRVNNVSEISANTKCILGHNYYGQHTNLGPFFYVTMLRDPVERVISHYYYIKYVIKDNEFTDMYNLKEFAQLEEFQNLQTRFITDNKLHLEQAIDNLKNFAFFGITEMFRESLLLMEKRLGWEGIQYKELNKNEKKPKKESISKETIKQIEKANLLDIELYQWARENFKSRLEEIEQ